ncbi:olfactory receptor 12D1-like [Bombina bombina]|uniref:olfactory receptor 12D1-like n=1 Tax=Bombina bombina TaxID=8345 RepID=UPI00235AC84C|nr:olfactory receptor 12D1-like [Bombina bombina]
MNVENQTSITHFVLLGLTDVAEAQLTLFAMVSLFYFTTLIGNISIFIIIIWDRSLHIPMYFFLWNLSILDILYSSVAVPKMITDFLVLEKKISFGGCISQIHFFHFFGSTEVVLLTAMSYDRYVALSKPLRYTIIMNSKVCLGLALFSWITGFFHSLIHSYMTAKLPFCGPNIVNHFFCDVKPLLTLACTDTSLNFKLLNFVTGTLVTSCLVFTLLSYAFISKCILKIKTLGGRKNALYTCTAHLTVVFIHFGTAIFSYLRPSQLDSLDQDKAVAVLFSVITPALNPIIYTLRNKDMKRAIKRFINRFDF